MMDATIQDANMDRLKEIDPYRMAVVKIPLNALYTCSIDEQDGKGVCVLLPDWQSGWDALCLKHAIEVATQWLADPDHPWVMVGVYR